MIDEIFIQDASNKLTQLSNKIFHLNKAILRTCQNTILNRK
jgi:hypothetical protein